VLKKLENQAVDENRLDENTEEIRDLMKEERKKSFISYVIDYANSLNH
jgi:hypothetical protein